MTWNNGWDKVVNTGEKPALLVDHLHSGEAATMTVPAAALLDDVNPNKLRVTGSRGFHIMFDPNFTDSTPAETTEVQLRAVIGPEPAAYAQLKILSVTFAIDKQEHFFYNGQLELKIEVQQTLGKNGLVRVVVL